MTNPDKTQAQLAAAAMLELLALGEADIRAGRLVPQEQVFASVRSQLLKRLESRTPDGRQTPPKERPT